MQVRFSAKASVQPFPQPTFGPHVRSHVMAGLNFSHIQHEFHTAPDELMLEFRPGEMPHSKKPAIEINAQYPPGKTDAEQSFQIHIPATDVSPNEIAMRTLQVFSHFPPHSQYTGIPTNIREFQGAPTIPYIAADQTPEGLHGAFGRIFLQGFDVGRQNQAALNVLRRTLARPDVQHAFRTLEDRIVIDFFLEQGPRQNRIAIRGNWPITAVPATDENTKSDYVNFDAATEFDMSRIILHFLRRYPPYSTYPQFNTRVTQMAPPPAPKVLKDPDPKSTEIMTTQGPKKLKPKKPKPPKRPDPSTES